MDREKSTTAEDGRKLRINEKVQAQLAEAKIESEEIKGDEHFDAVYEEITQIITSASKDIFGSRKMTRTDKITTPQIRAMVHQIHQIGRIVSAIKSETITNLIFDNPKW
jgi:hypothetical protein